MRIKLPITSQFGKPEGITGNLIGRIMSFRNKERVRWTVEKMGIRPDDTILEIGFGPGYSVRLISELLNGGTLTGIDHSEEMYKQAVKENREGIKNGKVKLLLSAFEKVMLPEKSYDKIFAINVHWFWKEPRNVFVKLHKLLKDDGNLFLIFQPRWAKSSEQLNRITDDAKQLLEEAGFSIGEIAVKEMKPVNCIFMSSNKK